MKRLLLIALIGLLAPAMQAQCYPDRHNGTWFDAWVSCVTSMNPNTERGVGHWIHYDLGYDYALGEMHFWNINEPGHLNRGAQEIAIDVSMDGENWVEVGTYFTPQADATSIYEGIDLMDFDGQMARYLLITVLSDHGDGQCTGFAELRIDVDGELTDIEENLSGNTCFDFSIFPNPHRDRLDVQINGHCSGVLEMQLYDAMGRIVKQMTVADPQIGQLHRMDNSELPAGLYFLEVAQGDTRGRYQVVKVQD